MQVRLVEMVVNDSGRSSCMARAVQQGGCEHWQPHLLRNSDKKKVVGFFTSYQAKNKGGSHLQLVPGSRPPAASSSCATLWQPDSTEDRSRWS